MVDALSCLRTLIALLLKQSHIFEFNMHMITLDMHVCYSLQYFLCFGAAQVVCLMHNLLVVWLAAAAGNHWILLSVCVC